MKAFCITIEGNEVSERGLRLLRESSEMVFNEFEINKFRAMTPDDVDNFMGSTKLKWTYPWEGFIQDPVTGLVLSAYQTRNPKARISCFVSHYTLWIECMVQKENFLILEHDAQFIRKLPELPIEDGWIVGINNPMGATRKAKLFHDTVQSNLAEIQDAPLIDHIKVPQGIAGNSAYIMTPGGARKMIDRVKQVGCWPNDAIMCKQLFGNDLKVTRTYYTKVQGLPSTTTM